VTDIVTAAGDDPAEVLALAASADQLSLHVLGQAVVAQARAQGLSLRPATDVVETAGVGVAATVSGQRIEVGRRLTGTTEDDWTGRVQSKASLEGATVVWIHVDGRLRGAVLLRDPLRPDANRTIRRLRGAGLRRLVLLTGDHATPAQEIGTILGLDDVRAEQTPASKLAAVREETRRAVTIMAGDGINDAPALAAATVGVAMGVRGATAASQAADVVLTTDRLGRLADAMDVARRARRIAAQSALAGMAMSLVAMGVAAVGLLPAAGGALLQEGIDVAVIGNALRALRPPSATIPVSQATDDMLHRFAAEHDRLRGMLQQIRDAADAIATASNPYPLAKLRQTRRTLVEQILPHEDAEEQQLYPALAAPLGAEATIPMSRTHAEIFRLTARLSTHVDQLERDGRIDPESRADLLACLYGLHAILNLHFIQEEESYFALTENES
jgi:soluble P-type ATPase/hemerythrin-like domain-containing protein